MNAQAVILAAGLGKRMRSPLPKVVQPLCGQEMVLYVLHALEQAGIHDTVAIVGHGAEHVRRTLGDRVSYVEQTVQAGTGHAVLQAVPWLQRREAPTLVVCGDTPLLTAQTLAQLCAHHESSGAVVTILTAVVSDPTGMGRIVREQGVVTRIVEERDASVSERAIQEVNAGVYVFDTAFLCQLLPEVRADNAQGEYYLTDVIGLLVQQGCAIATYTLTDPLEAQGVNDWAAMAVAEQTLRHRIATEHLRAGVRIIDPYTTYIDVCVTIEPQTIIYPQTHIRGNTRIGAGCVLGPGCDVTDSILGDEVRVLYSVLVEASIGAQTTVGPYAYVRPGSDIGEQVKIGDFVEVKNATIGARTKIPHHAYVGDATVGEETNIGCGVITANFNGVSKHRTTIGDRVFVGSNATLVAPVTIGHGAIVAAGSTITEEVDEHALALARAHQTTKADYAPILKTKWTEQRDAQHTTATTLDQSGG